MPYCQNCGAMVIGYFCEGCGQRVILPPVRYPRPLQPVLPPQSSQSIEKQPAWIGDIMIIVVAVIIIIFFMIMAVLFIFFYGPESDEHIVTPKGSLTSIEDDTIEGRYYVIFAGSVKNKDLEIRITDASTGMTAVMVEPVDGEIANCPSGFSLTYDDANGNFKLDASDTLLIQNGALNDELTVVYKPSSEIVARIQLT